MKRCGILLLALCLLLLCAPKAQAAQTASFSLRPVKDSVAPGENVQLLLSCTAPASGDLSAFRFRLPYDENLAQFREVSAKGGLTKGELQTSVQDGVVTIVYLTGREGLPIGKEETPLLTVTFTALSGIQEEEIPFFAEIDGACSYDLQPYGVNTQPSVTVPVAYPPEADQPGDALLRVLQPDTGTLSPAFDPERFAYTLEVPYTVTSVLFYAEPRREGAAVKVNRKNLGAMGSTTAFTVTVTSPDKSRKQVYEVAVKRGVKPAAGAVSSSGGKTPSSKPSSRAAGGTAGAASGKPANGAAPSRSGALEKGNAASLPRTGDGQAVLEFPFRSGSTGSFFLGIAAAACVGGAVFLLVRRKKRPTSRKESD